MRIFFAIVILVFLSLDTGPAFSARFDVFQTVGDFLSACEIDKGPCYARLNRDLDQVVDFELSCPPSSLTSEAAGAASLSWLRNAAAADKTLLKKKVSDADFNAFATLWPCSQ
jgi:hypothetical protein